MKNIKIKSKETFGKLIYLGVIPNMENKKGNEKNIYKLASETQEDEIQVMISGPAQKFNYGANVELVNPVINPSIQSLGLNINLKLSMEADKIVIAKEGGDETDEKSEEWAS